MTCLFLYMCILYTYNLISDLSWHCLPGDMKYGVGITDPGWVPAGQLGTNVPCSLEYINNGLSLYMYSLPMRAGGEAAMGAGGATGVDRGG